MPRDFHLPGRSPVYACEGMAATSHPLATLVAIETLKAGGTAADAAVAAVATLGDVEPHMTGIGGDCFCLVARPDKPVWGYNGSGRAGAGASTEALLARGIESIGMSSIHAVTVPGAVEAWANILGAHGRFGLDRALAPAIRFADNGFPVAPRVAFDWALAVERLRADAGAARHFLVNGRAPSEGEVIKLPALAATLKTIAKEGPSAFYQGPIAEEIVTTIASRGSVLTTNDFARHRGTVEQPISTTYRGYDFYELPPNGQGITALVLLNILERFELAKLEPLGPERFHIVLEAARMAFAVRDAHVADPAYMHISTQELLDKKFAAQLASRIDREHRATLSNAAVHGGDTVYVTVVDRDRTAVSMINSLFSGFGVGICTEKSGILLNNRGACFVLNPEHPNSFGAGKRPLHTIIPALAYRNGYCELAFGVMGAHYQPMGHVQIVNNMVDYGMDAQAAIDAPRAFFDGDLTLVERGISAATVAGLRTRGHNVMVAPVPFGGGQTIKIDWERDSLIGGSDARKDGCALGY